MEYPERTYITWPGKGCGLAFSEPAKTRTEYVRADLCASCQQVRALVEKMQRYVCEYLEPGGYVQKHGDKAGQTFNDPHQHQSEGYAYFMRNEARKAILNDLIYMLYGPEQREALAAPVRAELVTKDNTALAEALHPFARLIEVSGLRNCDKDTPVITQGPDEDRRSITVADFLRAEAALTPAPQPEGLAEPYATFLREVKARAALDKEQGLDQRMGLTPAPDAGKTEAAPNGHFGDEFDARPQPKSLHFRFDRYINGNLMAEGVEITRQSTLEGAIQAAAKIASRGPNGEIPVLVLGPCPPHPAAPAPGIAEAIAAVECMDTWVSDDGRELLVSQGKVIAALRALEGRDDG